MKCLQMIFDDFLEFKSKVLMKEPSAVALELFRSGNQDLCGELTYLYSQSGLPRRLELNNYRCSHTPASNC